MFNLIYSPRARKALKKFPQEYQKLILKKTLALQETPKPRGYDKIVAKNPPLYRIRIGDYRIFYFIEETAEEVIVVDIIRRTTQTYR